MTIAHAHLLTSRIRFLKGVGVIRIVLEVCISFRQS